MIIKILIFSIEKYNIFRITIVIFLLQLITSTNIWLNKTVYLTYGTIGIMCSYTKAKRGFNTLQHQEEFHPFYIRMYNRKQEDNIPTLLFLHWTNSKIK